MRFGVLGPLALWTDDGTPVAVPGLKVRMLVADLLAHEGRPVPADRLIDDLWAGALPGSPGGALSAKVSQLRRVLEDAEAGARALVVSRPAGYVLQVAPDRVDALAFRSLSARALETGEPVARTAMLGDALALWRGPAFADFADEPFARSAIARLEELRLVALEEQAEARLALGEHGLVAAELADVVAAHPFRERLRAAHMLALHRAGRRGEALEGYEWLRAELSSELGIEPGANLVALRDAIAAGDRSLEAPAAPVAVSRPRRRTNLPAPAGELVGREAAVAELASCLDAHRLVTLTGPGGVGKTRLAVEVAARRAGVLPDGAWLVDLATGERSDQRQVVEALMRALDVRDGAGRPGPALPVDRLAGALRGRRLLLVLDNCEHVAAEAAELVAALLPEAPGLRVLATSREPLGLAAEVVWDVPPLDVPAPGADDPAAVLRSSAVRLFVARATAAARGFRLDAGNAAAVAVLCRRLDGIPLALELAATRVRTLGVHGLVARLDDRFRALASGPRGVPRRHRTLAAVIDWSWALLSDPERALLRRLAVHADGCTLEAAEAVCAGNGVAAEDVLDLLVRLVDRSLVVMTDRGEDGPRYRLLESVAAYCIDRMEETGEAERVRCRHRRHYLDVAERAVPRLYGHDQARWLRLLDAEAANLRAAIDGAVAGGHGEQALRLVNALAWYWFLRGRLTEARRSLSAALALGGESSARRATALAWHAGFALLQGDEAGWAARREAALRAFQDAGDRTGRARAQWWLAFTASEVDDLDAGAALLDRAMEGLRAAGDRWGQAAVHILRAKHAHIRGAPAALEREGGLAARLFAEVGDRWGQQQAAEWLGGLAELTGDYDRADRLQREGLRLAEELELWPDVATRLAWLGWSALMRGAYPQARERCERALRLAVEQGHQVAIHFAEIGLAYTARREGRLDAAEDGLLALLRALPRDEDVVPPTYLSLIQVGLGQVAEQRGDAAAALAFHRDALSEALRMGAPRPMAFALEGLAGALSLAGRHIDAARLLGAAAAVRRPRGLAPGPVEREDIGRTTARIRSALKEHRLAGELDHGAALSAADCLRIVG